MVNDEKSAVAETPLLKGLRPLLELLPPPGVGGASDLLIRNAFASVMRELGDFDAAERLYQEILEEQPKNQGALRNRVVNALRGSDMLHALDCVDEALEEAPDDPNLLQSRATILGRLGRHEEAVADLERRRSACPADIPATLAVAQALSAAGKHARADAEFAAILARESDHLGALLGRIDSALSLGDPHLALEHCHHALKLLPGEPQLREKQAIVLHRCGRSSEAVTRLRALIKEDPARLVRRTWLANALRAAGDNEAAMSAYDEVLAAEPANEAALLGRIDTALAVGDVDSALELCDRAISAKDGPLYQQRRAIALGRAGRSAESIERLELLHRESPEDLALTLDLARARLASGDLDGADRLFAEVLEAEPGQRVALLGRADIRDRQGDPAGAMALLEESLDLHKGRADGSAAA